MNPLESCMMFLTLLSGSPFSELNLREKMSMPSKGQAQNKFIIVSIDIKILRMLQI